MNRFNQMGWYEQDQRKRKEARENFEISNLNRRAQELLKGMNSKINLVEIEEESLHLVNRELRQCSILFLQYANNFNSKKVLAAQLEYMTYLMNKYPDLENERTRTFIKQATYQAGYEMNAQRAYWSRVLN